MQKPLPPPDEPDDKKAITWPLGINLTILLLAAIVGGPGMLPGTIGTLIIVNGLAGLIVMMTGNRMHYALAFFLSVLLLLLIGLGICGIIVSQA